MSAAQRGDRAALEALLRRHHDRLAALCRRLVGNDADGQDATQEALIAVVKGLERFDGRAAFTTWSYRVAVNACLDELRRRGRRPALGLQEDGDSPLPAAALSAEPTDSLSDRLLLEPALARLPAEYRVPVVLRDICDLDYAQIAATLDIPPGTVRSRIARGRAQLARLLGDADGNRTPATGRPTSGHDPAVSPLDGATEP